MTMTLHEFKQQVLSLADLFPEEETVFNKVNEETYTARTYAGFAAVVFKNGKFQVLINGSPVQNPSFAHENINKALLLAQRRASCFQFVDARQLDTYNKATFDYSV